MDNDPVVTQCQKMLEETLLRLADWQRTSPKATFAEIEDAVEEEVARFRAQLIVDLVSTRSGGERASGGDRPTCPECGQPMERRGDKARAVTVRGNRTVRFRRGHAICPACGAGVFPPG